MNKQEAEQALLQELSLYDKVENVLYLPDVSSEPYRFYGIQEFYLSVPEEEIREEYETISDFCVGYIPASGASSGNEYGYAHFTGFDMPEDRDETEEEILEELSWYVDRLEEEGILSRLIVDERKENE